MHRTNQTMAETLPTPKFLTLSRASNLDRMRREVFDLAVIGGGITGAGIALDAASRGLTVALIEKRDFASGTSSRSSKLIHGGLRYLEQFNFGLVRESLHERAALSRMAPHLSRPLEFLVPVYSSSERSPLGSNKLKLTVGLWLYDLLAGRQNIGRHRWLPRDDALKLSPALDPDGLRGAFCYYDCLTDDARLVIEVIKTASAYGAVVANYARANAFGNSNGRITSVNVEDVFGRSSLNLRAKVMVNATGVWSDEVSRLSDAAASRKLRPSKGIHVIVPSEKINIKSAALIPSIGERRFLFVIPWQGRTLIGTTDTDYQGDLDEPIAESVEVERVMASAARAFPGANLTIEDVISTFAGLRPLIAGDGASTKELSRKEEIFEDKSGLITMTGGKLTTWRRMSERVVDRVVDRLENVEGERFPRRHQSVTERIRLAGGPANGEPEVVTRISTEFGVDPSTVEHLLECYGANYRVILELTRESEQLESILTAGLAHIEAEVVYTARYEMAATVEDFLSRRSRIELLARDHGRSCAARVAILLSHELGWSPAETQNALAEFVQADSR
ncbi:MAG: glycerol-3-phosphate dehydrogenase/oxidase [Blastocatellia bacterium]